MFLGGNWDLWVSGIRLALANSHDWFPVRSQASFLS
jgi:hypothetical protein